MYLFEDERPKLYFAAWGGRNFPSSIRTRRSPRDRGRTGGLSRRRRRRRRDPSRRQFSLQDRRFLTLRARARGARYGLARTRHARSGGAGAHPAQHARVPIASCETLHGRRAYKPFFEQYAMDVAIVDVAWNGALESMKIAAMADTYEVNVATHNWGSPLLDLMSAHLRAAIPNLRIMEYEVDGVPWRDELVTVPPVVVDGALVLRAVPAGAPRSTKTRYALTRRSSGRRSTSLVPETVARRRDDQRLAALRWRPLARNRRLDVTRVERPRRPAALHRRARCIARQQRLLPTKRSLAGRARTAVALPALRLVGLRQFARTRCSRRISPCRAADRAMPVRSRNTPSRCLLALVRRVTGIRAQSHRVALGPARFSRAHGFARRRDRADRRLRRDRTANGAPACGRSRRASSA